MKEEKNALDEAWISGRHYGGSWWDTPLPPSVETGQISSIFSGNAQMLHQASSGLHQLYGNKILFLTAPTVRRQSCSGLHQLYGNDSYSSLRQLYGASPVLGCTNSTVTVLFLTAPTVRRQSYSGLCKLCLRQHSNYVTFICTLFRRCWYWSL
jgi:hypothetical protein